MAFMIATQGKLLMSQIRCDTDLNLDIRNLNTRAGDLVKKSSD
ncbi:MAG: hypothetical protein RR327_04465 [Clostridia bacterium]